MCVQVDDNIPLRVMLLLMDEVFDLKEKNQWLRRNIKNLLQQLIRATYGDTINRSRTQNTQSRLKDSSQTYGKYRHIYSRPVRNVLCIVVINYLISVPTKTCL